MRHLLARSTSLLFWGRSGVIYFILKVLIGSDGFCPHVDLCQRHLSSHNEPLNLSVCMLLSLYIVLV